VLSYSLDLWQQPFLNRHSDAWVNAFPQNLVFALAAALLSYFVVERAFLGLRNRFRRAAALPTRDLTNAISGTGAQLDATTMQTIIGSIAPPARTGKTP
jgi:peptidoglycan/LPS O-acetylase OafA/YrhL